MNYFIINVLHRSKRVKLHLCILLLLWEAHFICLGLAFQVPETEIIITYVITLVVNAVCKGCVLLSRSLSQGHYYHLQIEEKLSRSYFLASGCPLPSVYIPGPSFPGIYPGIPNPSQPAGSHPCLTFPKPLTLTPHTG